MVIGTSSHGLPQMDYTVSKSTKEEGDECPSTSGDNDELQSKPSGSRNFGSNSRECAVFIPEECEEDSNSECSKPVH